MTLQVTPELPTSGAGRAPRTSGPAAGSRRAPSSLTGLRFCALASYGAVLFTWIQVVGIPADPVQLVVWTWLATVAWHFGEGVGTHVRFVRDWSLPVVLLLFYAYVGGVADRFGMPVHTRLPIRIGEWIGHGRTATEVLQGAWCGNPCSATAGAHWYDTLFTLTYLSHFVTAPIIAAVLYLVNRAEWGRWMRRYLLLSACGLLTYILYPMAPPWMASQEGLLHTHPVRLTGRGAAGLGLHFSNFLRGEHGDLVGAMPSLHVGTATLVSGFFILQLGRRGRWARRLRWALVLYPATMAISVIYFAEHYLIDTVAGAVLALAVLSACSRWEAWRMARARTRHVQSVVARQAQAQAARLLEFEEAQRVAAQRRDDEQHRIA